MQNKPLLRRIIILSVLGIAVCSSIYYLYLSQRNKLTNAPIPQPAQTGVQVVLISQNNSGESGTALLEEKDGHLIVTLDLQGYGKEAQPAHIHAGNCSVLGPIEYPLTNVVNGRSITTLNTTINQLKQKLPLIVNVHESASKATNYVSCGELQLD